MAKVPGSSIGSTVGDYIREQREHTQVSLRQLAKSAGVSNPYLSQIERGLKKPSAEILQQIAKGLRISAETLYVRAGILEDQGEGSDVVGALLTDPYLDDRQKRVLLDIYASFRAGHDAKDGVTATRRTRKAVIKKAAAKRPKAPTRKKQTATKQAKTRRSSA